MSIDTTSTILSDYRNGKQVTGTDNPPNQFQGIHSLRIVNDNIRLLCGKYKLQFAGYDVLVRIVDRWTGLGLGSTVYGISEGVVSHRTKIQMRVTILLSRGLIEIIGRGYNGCAVYAPSSLALQELNNIVKP